MIIKKFKSTLLSIIDFTIFFCSIFLIMSLHKSDLILIDIVFSGFIASIIGVILIYCSGGYHSVLSNINLYEDWWKYCLIGSASSFSFFLLYHKNFLYFLDIFIAISFFVILSRLIGSRNKFRAKGKTKNICIYGAGQGGISLMSFLNYSNDTNIVYFVDDDKELQGRKTSGIDIISLDSLKKKIQHEDIDELIIAIPSLNIKEKNELFAKLSDLKLPLKISPSIKDIIENSDIKNVRPVQMEEMLGRSAVKPDGKLLQESIDNESILITGAGGSIGSEISKQISGLNPSRIVLLDSSEYALYKIEQDLLKQNVSFEVIPILGSILDRALLERIIPDYSITVIFHAAAYKHVPMVESNIIQSVNNNIFGTLELVNAIENKEIKKFILISSDKAVRPTNVMGATKRICEMIIQARANHNKKCNIKFSMVRFGNVLESSGSVIPLFQSQIESGGPITLTHKEITRYFMTISEAAQLVLQSASLPSHGDVFVLDMGDPVKIFDLAKLLIKINRMQIYDSEKNPNGIKIKITGLRPGEKLYEELIIDDNAKKTAHPKIMQAREVFKRYEDLEIDLRNIRKFIQNEDKIRLRELIMNLAFYE